jgi:hypothetical protein
MKCLFLILKYILKIFLKIQEYFLKTITKVVKKQVGVTCVIPFAPPIIKSLTLLIVIGAQAIPSLFM